MKSLNNVIILLGIMACILTFTSCENTLDTFTSCEKPINGECAPTQQANINVATNSELDGIAQAISLALQSSEDFNNIIKNKALEKFDGDYDVMLQTLGKQELSDYNSTRVGGNGVTTVAMLLNEKFPNNKTRSVAPDDIIKYLTEKYPLLQVSVPVNADKWEDGYIPTVVFIGDDYVDGVTEFVKGYDNTGKEVWVDAINEPDVPVIVIGMNERGGLDATKSLNRGNNLNFEECATRAFVPDTGLIINPGLDRLMAPINVTATTTATGINVAWSMNSTSLPATKYYIYRKCETENDFAESGL